MASNANPTGFTYNVDDVPPPGVLFLLGVQHLFLMSSTLVLPIVLVSEIGGGSLQVQAVVATTMMACGIGTIVQAMRWRGVGSGFLCPNLCGPNFFTASMSAAWLGGLPLMRGMTIAAGLVEVLFAKLLPRLAFLFPTEITGLVVFMVAFELVPLGTSKFFGVDYAGDPIQTTVFIVAACTLLIMVAINVWGSAKLRLYGVLIGMVAGYIASAAAGLVTPADWESLAKAPWIGLPHYQDWAHLEFHWALLPAWAIVSICGALKSLGNLVLCEKINDPSWNKPNTHRISNGLVADAISVIASGLCGGVASDTSASNVAFSSVSGATSRWIGVAAGVLFAVLGFSPKLSALLSIMPEPVAGAIVIFVTCFMLISGVQIILSSRLNVNQTFVIGVSLIFGMSLAVLPQLYGHVPSSIRPLFGSSLTLSTVMAILLNQLLRLRSQGTPKPEMIGEG